VTTGSIIGKNDIFRETTGLPRKINQNGKDGSIRLGRYAMIYPIPSTGGFEAEGQLKMIANLDISDEEKLILSGNRKKVLTFPTPTTNDAKNNGSESQMMRNSQALNCLVKMHPTPRASDSEGGVCELISGTNQRISKNGISAGAKLSNIYGAARLNPEWVEWLQGFPTGWTELSASETPLSRKLRKSSQEQSKNMRREDDGLHRIL